MLEQMKQVLGTWSYYNDKYRSSFTVRQVDGKLIFTECDVIGQLYPDNCWLVAALRYKDGLVHGIVRIRYEEGHLVTSFKKEANSPWDADVIAVSMKGSMVGTWCYKFEGHDCSFSIHEMNGRLIFTECDVTGDLYPDGDWLVATLHSVDHHFHGMVRVRLQDDNVITSFRTDASAAWDADLVAARGNLDSKGSPQARGRPTSAASSRRPVSASTASAKPAYSSALAADLVDSAINAVKEDVSISQCSQSEAVISAPTSKG